MFRCRLVSAIDLVSNHQCREKQSHKRFWELCEVQTGSTIHFSLLIRGSIITARRVSNRGDRKKD